MTEAIFHRLSRVIKSSDEGENYKTIKKNEASTIDESFLVHSRRKYRMHPWKDIRYSDPSSLQVLYLLIANIEEKQLSYQITDEMWLQ